MRVKENVNSINVIMYENRHKNFPNSRSLLYNIHFNIKVTQELQRP